MAVVLVLCLGLVLSLTGVAGGGGGGGVLLHHGGVLTNKASPPPLECII